MRIHWVAGFLLLSACAADTLEVGATSAALTPVTWTDLVGVSAAGNDLTKTAPENTFNTGAVSVETIASGDGYVEFRALEATTAKAAGLSSGNSGAGRADIDFAIQLNSDGVVSIYQGGSKIRNAGTYVAGDFFQVSVSAGVVTYFKNRVPLYTSAAAPTFPMLLDTSLRTPNARIADARLVAGRPLEDCAPFEQSIVGEVSGARLGEYMSAAEDLMVARGSASIVVYRRGAGGWALEQELDTGVNELDTDGQTIAAIVGVQDDIQVFRHDGVQWVDDGFITGCQGDRFRSVAVAGDLLVAGEAGFSYVYRRGPAGWQLDGVLRALGGTSDSSFGIQSAVGGTHAFVGADSDSTAAEFAGAIYVFRYNPALPDPGEPVSCANRTRGKWRQRALLTASNAAFGQSFPWAMDASADGTRLLAGNQGGDSAHVFELVLNSWSERSILTPQPLANRFGWMVGLGGSDSAVAVVGSNRSLTGDVDGRAYVFAELAGVWQQIDYLTGPPSYGDEVAATADDLFIADRLDDAGGSNAGAIRVHAIEPLCLLE